MMQGGVNHGTLPSLSTHKILHSSLRSLPPLSSPTTHNPGGYFPRLQNYKKFFSRAWFTIR